MARRPGKIPWRGLSLQAGVLVGAALAFIGGARPIEAGPLGCMNEGMCSFKKPILMFVVEYTGAMAQPYKGRGSRWDAALEHIAGLLNMENGFIANSFMLGLARYAHDEEPFPDTMGPTGLIDGVRVDVSPIDKVGQGKPYVECTNADAILTTLAGLPPPQDDLHGGWTRGGLLAASKEFTDVFTAHPEDKGTRAAGILLYTQGYWSNPDGTKILSGPADQPEPVAQALFDGPSIPTTVVHVGDAITKMFADQIATAGGTAAAYEIEPWEAVFQHYEAILQALQDGQVTPICTPGKPRIMILLDASSKLLNVDDEHAPAGAGGWEEIRGLLAGDWLYEEPSPLGDMEGAVHIGLAAFGSAGEQKLLTQYGPCQRAPIAWAIDPASSCVAPGCTDPYGAPPILWTEQDGWSLFPWVKQTTLSHMPKCEGPGDACSGSGANLLAGLQLLQDNLDSYRSECQMPNSEYPCDAGTEFVNLLITDGHDESGATVKDALQDLYAAGVTTYVMGVGTTNPMRLDQLANWGSGGTQPAYTLMSQDELAAELALVVDAVGFDPCCAKWECGGDDGDDPEPNTSDTAPSSTSMAMSSSGELPDSDTEDESGSSYPTSTVTDAGEASSASLTGEAPTDPGDPMTASTSDSATETDAGDASDSSALDDQGGCGCTTRGSAPGWLVLAGFCRRRRRRSGRRDDAPPMIVVE